MRWGLAFVSVGVVLSACMAAPAAEPPDVPERRPMIVGGFRPADLSDAGVEAAQAVAEKAIYERDPTRALVEMVTAESQVVAGRNYRFTITMSGGASYRITVYQPLQGEMTVSAYEKLS